jgi:kynurenine formamidase
MKVVWLSHVLAPDTPLYGGEDKIGFTHPRSMARGDSCNTTLLGLSSHAGTHVDVPRHFLPAGGAVEHYPPETWLFHSPLLIEISVPPGELIRPEDVTPKLPLDQPIDILLVKTGFSLRRQEEIYWRQGPGLSPALGEYLKNGISGLRAVGVDFLSVSSLARREEGREAHRALLEREILIFEDLALGNLQPKERLTKIIALPLRFQGGDGAPCSVLGWVEG